MIVFPVTITNYDAPGVKGVTIIGEVFSTFANAWAYSMRLAMFNVNNGSSRLFDEPSTFDYNENTGMIEVYNSNHELLEEIWVWKNKVETNSYFRD